MRWQTIYEARWIFLAILLLSAITATITSFLAPALTPWASAVWLLFVLYVFYFFRDPDRATPSDPDIVVAAADGVIAEIIEIEEPEVVKATMKRVAIFLSVFDVHTNKAPRRRHDHLHRTPRRQDARRPPSGRFQTQRMPHLGH